MRGATNIMNNAKPAASPIITPIWSQLIPPDASPPTRASMIIPRMSSNTAAPRMIFAVSVEQMHVSKNARGDSYAGCYHGGADESRLAVGRACQLHISKAEQEWNDHTSNSNAD